MTCASENERRGEISYRRLWVHPSTKVNCDREQRASQEEPHHVTVDLARVKHALRSDNTPDNRGVEENTTVGTSEVTRVLGVADIANSSTQGPIEDGYLNKACPDRGNDLAPEKRTWRNFHVVAHFETLEESEGLGHRDITISLKKHHSNRTSRLDITNDEFSDNIETQLYVGDGLDDTTGDCEYTCDHESNKESPP